MKTYVIRVTNSLKTFIATEYVEAETYMKAFNKLRQQYPFAYFTLMGIETCEVCE